jgi:hypothetical protein
VLWRTGAIKSSCFRGPDEVRFVLWRTVTRAFTDPHSCLARPLGAGRTGRFGIAC